MSYRNTSLAGAAALSALALAFPAAAGTITITAIVLEGDTVKGVGTIGGTSPIAALAINDGGTWRVEADTLNPDTDIDAVVLAGTGPGAFSLLLQEGQSLLAPAGASLNTFDSVTINNSGNSGWNFFLSGTTGTIDDSGVYFNTTLVIQENDVSTATGFSPNTPYRGFSDVKINNSGQIMFVGLVDDPAFATTSERAIVLIDDPLGAATETVIVKEPDELLEGRTVEDFGVGLHDSAFNDSGHILFSANLTGDSLNDGVIGLWNGTRVVILEQEGSPSVVEGRTWGTLLGTSLDMNNKGDWVMRGDLSGALTDDSLIVKNGTEILAREGSSLPAIGGVFTFTSFGTGNVAIDDNGNVAWYGDWNDGNLDIDTGLFLNDQLIVQEGVTTIDGVIVDSFNNTAEGNLAMSDNGQWIVFEATLVGGNNGAFLIEIPQPEPCPSDINGDDTTDVNDLLLLIGAWGSSDPAADINDDNIVDVNDLLLLIGGWGDC